MNNSNDNHNDNINIVDHQQRQQRLVLDTGAIYVGSLVDQEMHGFGRLTTPDGYYVGDFQNDKRHGKGVWAYTELNETDEALIGKWAVYEGDWKDDKPSGHGCLLFRRGSRYEGEWLDGKCHGRGIYKSPRGDEVYEGEWVKNNKQGKGYNIYASGEEYEGEFLNNTRTGVGRFRYYWPLINQSLPYSNEMIAINTHRFISGDVYEGDWVDDEPHGKGKFVSQQYGYTFKGEYERGVRVKGRIDWLNGDSWEGTCYEDQSCKGVMKIRIPRDPIDEHRNYDENDPDRRDEDDVQISIIGEWEDCLTMENGKGLRLDLGVEGTLTSSRRFVPLNVVDEKGEKEEQQERTQKQQLVRPRRGNKEHKNKRIKTSHDSGE